MFFTHFCDTLIKLCALRSGSEKRNESERTYKKHIFRKARLCSVGGGWINAAIPILIVPYYSVIGGWVFNAMIRLLCPFFAAIILISSVANAFGWISM